MNWNASQSRYHNRNSSVPLLEKKLTCICTVCNAGAPGMQRSPISSHSHTADATRSGGQVHGSCASPAGQLLAVRQLLCGFGRLTNFQSLSMGSWCATYHITATSLVLPTLKATPRSFGQLTPRHSPPYFFCLIPHKLNSTAAVMSCAAGQEASLLRRSVR